MTKLVTNEIFHDFLKCKYKAFLDLTFETIKPSEYKLRTFEHLSHNSNEIYSGLFFPDERLEKSHKILLLIIVLISQNITTRQN